MTIINNNLMGVHAAEYTLLPFEYTITTNEDNFDFTIDGIFYSLLKFTNNTSSLDITGFIIESEGHYLTIYNSANSTQNIVLKYDDVNSSADNRIKPISGVDITLTPGEKTILLYLDGKWR